ncbi:YihY/virulence factor BrkB family protein [Haloprofundus halophilus]|uniref:YihY/virulence factor BrkB family protein n=1 Tax=Haloprofundus halophilus TaxID=2283527 RepID=UPI000E43AC4D|nr:YihY/virulence factor BrkB family protein [Haloprofundus halophilus]
MGLTSTLRTVVRVARDRDIAFLAAGFAYYALQSLIPLAILVFVLATSVGEGQVVMQLLDRVSAYVSESGRQVLEQALTSSAGRRGASLASLGFLLWGALKMFRGLSKAFGEVYGSFHSIGFFGRLLDGLLVLGVVLVAIALMVGAGVVVTFVDLSIPYPTFVTTLSLFVLLVLVLLPIYYILPPVPVTFRHVIPGTVVAAGGWILLQLAFLYYAQNASQYQAYGILGAVLLFVTWLYLGGVLVLLGAVVNVVIERPTPYAELRAPR